VISHKATHLSPVGTCCYRKATFSPDGTYMFFLFQDIAEGADGDTTFYYMPVDGSVEPVRIPIPLGFFSNVREDVLFALQSSAP